MFFNLDKSTKSTVLVKQKMYPPSSGLESAYVSNKFSEKEIRQR